MESDPIFPHTSYRAHYLRGLLYYRSPWGIITTLWVLIFTSFEESGSSQAKEEFFSAVKMRECPSSLLMSKS